MLSWLFEFVYGSRVWWSWQLDGSERWCWKGDPVQWLPIGLDVQIVDNARKAKEGGCNGGVVDFSWLGYILK